MLDLRRTSCLASKVRKTWERKYFYSTIFEGFNTLCPHHNFPFESIHKLLFATTKSPPGVCVFHDLTNDAKRIVNKEMCLSFFVKEDERRREWNPVIGNTRCRPCVLTVDLSSGDFNAGSSILKCAAQLSSLTWLHLKFLHFFQFFSFFRKTVMDGKQSWAVLGRIWGNAGETGKWTLSGSLTSAFLVVHDNRERKKKILAEWIKHYTMTN